jgi:hypothetical protein
MTHTTEEFEHTLDLENVTAVEYNEENDEVITFVSKKVPEEELNDNDIVSNNVNKKSRVIEIGDIYTEASGATMSPRGKNRPVYTGSSELNVNIETAGTAGPFPVRVSDTTKGIWDNNVREGDIVRLSNNHIYARSNDANLGEYIQQPSPIDGGSHDDIVGQLVGYVPLEDGTTVDVAARSVSPDNESQTPLGLSDEYAKGVFRDDHNKLMGETLVKTGRTSGVTRGNVLATTASTLVNFPDNKQFKMRDLIITEDMSRGGDSGSPAYHGENGNLVGMLLAGTDTVTVFCKATNIESEHGVRIMEYNEYNDTYEKPGEEYVESLRSNVSIEMDEHDLDVISISGDKPAPGEEFEATITVVGNRDGLAYIDVQDVTEEFTLSAGEERDISVRVKAPYVHGEAFDLDVRGGYIFREG